MIISANLPNIGLSSIFFKAMSPTRRYQRIAFSAACAITCTLFVALWVRSYRSDWLQLGDSWTWVDSEQRHFAVNSGDGMMFLSKADRLPYRRAAYQLEFAPERSRVAGIGFHRGHYSTCLTLPYWLLVLSTAVLGAAPWFKLHFSLRTFLVATTAVATLLGVVIAIG
jgi:hypothetical protein